MKCMIGRARTAVSLIPDILQELLGHARGESYGVSYNDDDSPGSYGKSADG